MFESETFENILSRLLSGADDIDKREGSVIYDSLASAAVEFTNAYIAIDKVLDNTFAFTAPRKFLIERAKERGLTPYPAVKSVVELEIDPSDIVLNSGDRFISGENTVFSVTERISGNRYKAECLEAGETGNIRGGSLIPVNYINGLTEVRVVSLLIPGSDEEDTESFRKRYSESFDSQAFGGNIADYKEKIRGISGVGGLKVYPAFAGGGTVGIKIIGSDYGAASEELINRVKEKIDPAEYSGSGYGLAPVGHKVTVESAETETVTINVSVKIENAGNAENSVREKIADYIKALNKEWEDNNDGLCVSFAAVTADIMSISGMKDCTVLINGEQKSYTCAKDKIAKGVISYEES